MKKFDNIFEQAREIIRQQWTLQDLRREVQCTGRPEAVRQQIAAARPRPTAQHSAGHITKHEKRFTP